MKVEKGIISSSQLLFMIIGFIQAGNLLLAFSSGVLKHDGWLALIAALVLSIPIALSYAVLSNQFPGKNLVQINDLIYGPYLGKLISISYIMIFLSLVSLNLRFFSDFLITYIMPETPIWAILIILTFVCAWAVRGGIEVIARCSFVIVAIASIIILSTTVLMLGDMELKNFLPIFDLPLKDFIHGVHIIFSIHYLEIVAFLMVMAYVNKSNQVKFSMLAGLVLGAFSILILEVRNIAVLGRVSEIVSSPSFITVRYLSVAEVFTRMEMLVAIMLIMTVFLKVSILYYGVVIGTAQILKLRTFVPLVIPIGIIAIILAMISVDSSMEMFDLGKNFWPIFIVPFLLVPVLSLLIARIRGLPGKRGSS